MAVIAKANALPDRLSFRKRCPLACGKLLFGGNFAGPTGGGIRGARFSTPRPPAPIATIDPPGSFEPSGTPPKGIRHRTLPGPRPRRLPGKTKRPCAMTTERERSWVLPAGPSPLPFDHPLRIPRHGQLDGTFDLFRLRGVAPPVTVEGHRAPHRDPWILERRGPTGSERYVSSIGRTQSSARPPPSSARPRFSRNGRAASTGARQRADVAASRRTRASPSGHSWRLISRQVRPVPFFGPADPRPPLTERIRPPRSEPGFALGLLCERLRSSPADRGSPTA